MGDFTTVEAAGDIVEIEAELLDTEEPHPDIGARPEGTAAFLEYTGLAADTDCSVEGIAVDGTHTELVGILDTHRLKQSFKF